MFLPLGDEPNPRGHAYVNYVLIAINVAVFALVALPNMRLGADPTSLAFRDYVAHLYGRIPASQLHEIASHVSQYDLIVYAYGYKPGAPSLLTVLTSMFLHGGWMHIAGNMLFLWIFGDNVEQRLGRFGYLVTYLATGAASVFYFALFSKGSMAPLVGASGAISGVLGLYFVWFPRNVVKTLFFMNIVRVPARFVLGFYLIVDNVVPFLVQGSSGGGVAHGAHIGGFLAGALLAWGLQKAGETSPQLEKFAPADMRLSRNVPIFDPVRAPRKMPVAGIAAFREALAGGIWFDVARVFNAMTDGERDKIDKGDVIRFSDWLTDQGEYDEALGLLNRAIELHAADPVFMARAHLRAGLVELHFKHDTAKAISHLGTVLSLDAPREMQDVARNALEQARVAGLH